MKRYLVDGAQPVYRRRRQPSLLDPFMPPVDQWHAREPHLLATRIHQDLVRDCGFRGSYQTVRRYVERSRPRPRPEAEHRFETASGHQARVDWSYEGPLRTASGLELPLYCFLGSGDALRACQAVAPTASGAARAAGRSALCMPP